MKFKSAIVRVCPLIILRPPGGLDGLLDGLLIGFFTTRYTKPYWSLTENVKYELRMLNMNEKVPVNR